MTNVEIERQAAKFAERHAARAEYLDAEDAWHRWSAEHRMTSPAARHLFEQIYQARTARLFGH